MAFGLPATIKTVHNDGTYTVEVEGVDEADITPPPGRAMTNAPESKGVEEETGGRRRRGKKTRKTTKRRRSTRRKH